jgi:hypothetical protein
MSEKNSGTQKGLDLLGLADLSKAINGATEASLEAAKGFLKIVCVPAAEISSGLKSKNPA